LFTDASAVNLAWVDIKLGRSDEAFNLMDAEVARFNPENSLFAITALVQRSQLRALAFQYDKAISDLDLALQYCLDSIHVTDSYCARYYTLRGQTYLLLYEWDKVAADYNQAIELDPTYADAYFYRGVLYYSILQTGQAMYTDALADFQRYLELAPNGEHADEATRYVTDIQTQINALNN
jgi:tetratricopeptide (TPR) repeat protein